MTNDFWTLVGLALAFVGWGIMKWLLAKAARIIDHKEP